MDYKLTVNDNGDTEVIKPAGSDFVRTCVCEGEAKAIIATASKVESSDKFDGFGIAVNDGEYYFAGNIGKASAKAEKAEKATDEPVKAEKKSVKKTTAKKKAE